VSKKPRPRKRGVQKLISASNSSGSEVEYQAPKKPRKSAKRGTRSRAKQKAHV